MDSGRNCSFNVISNANRLQSIALTIIIHSLCTLKRNVTINNY
jgi:hypothetical protein